MAKYSSIEEEYNYEYRLTKNNPYMMAYKRLASAIVESGIKENDIRFLKSGWCRILCDFVGIDIEVIRDHVKKLEGN